MAINASIWPTSRGSRSSPDGQFELVVDARSTTYLFSNGYLAQEPGAAPKAELVIHTTSAFLERWAAGDIDWDTGVAEGTVIIDGPAEAWRRWLAATGYELRYEPQAADARAC